MRLLCLDPTAVRLRLFDYSTLYITSTYKSNMQSNLSIYILSIQRASASSSSSESDRASCVVAFWPYAIQHSCHLHNVLPTRGLPEYISPYEKLYDKVPDLSKIKVFGCKGYWNVPDEKRKYCGASVCSRLHRRPSVPCHAPRRNIHSWALW